jgi:hypothetical protein
MSCRQQAVESTHETVGIGRPRLTIEGDGEDGVNGGG